MTGPAKRGSPFPLAIVEDNARLRAALEEGFSRLGDCRVLWAAASADEGREHFFRRPPEVVLMDVRLGSGRSGIALACELRREFPRAPVVFYSIEDDDAFFREFRASGIISHFAYVRKSNYLLPELLLPLMREAVAGRSFVDPDIEERFQEVAERDRSDPLALLEEGEQRVMELLAMGLTNEQIAAQLGFRDPRTISRVNGQIYAAWGLADRPVDEKIARLRAVLILRARRLIQWDEDGDAYVESATGDRVPWSDFR